MSASESRSAVVLQLAEEFLERYRQGQRPALKEYIDRHLSYASRLFRLPCCRSSQKSAAGRNFPKKTKKRVRFFANPCIGM